MTRKSFDLEHSRARNENSNIHATTNTSPRNNSMPFRRLFKRVKITDTNTDANTPEGKEKVPMVSLLSLFRYTDRIDIICIVVATIAAIANGATLPLMLVVFGGITDTFTDRSTDFCHLNFTYLSQFCPSGTTLTATNFLTEFKKCNHTEANITVPSSGDFGSGLHDQVVYLVVLGCVSIPLAYVQITLWSIAAERQMRKLRGVLFHAILHKEIGFFDTHQSAEFNTRLSEDVSKIQNGIGNKLGVAQQNISVFIAGIILGFVKGWRLTLVILSVSPVLFISALLFTRLTAILTSQELRSYSKAGSIAHEVLSNIRTVYSYNGSEYESERYEKHLEAAKKVGFRKGAINGILQGFIWLIVFCSYALGFWYGGRLVREENYSVGDVLTVFFSIVTAVFSLGQTAPHLSALAQARGAAFALWQIIDTPSKISSDSEDGIKEGSINGNIQFTNITFSYPSRPNVLVLSKLSIEAKCGETIALVGDSGSGKSTCCQLLQRYYDTVSGTILIDGRRIEEYNLSWLRKQIGVVSQEPVLFQKSIYENIKDGNCQATKEQIEDAARIANAHEFIMALPDTYQTLVGEGGALLSGGQKQRIAIARAVVKNPKILLLDEATSALDSESESVVQTALDQAATGRTTIVVAHRLSTIVNASKIYVFSKGSIVEEGNHQQLMDKRGTYCSLVEIQSLSMDVDEIDRNVSTDSVRIDQVVLDSDSLHDQEHDKIVAKEKQDESKKRRFTFFTMMKLNSPEIWYILVGCIACICNGGIQPAFGIVFSKLIVIFGECDKSIQERNILFYVILFIAFGFLMLITNFLQSFLFAVSGEKLTERIRGRVFRIFLQQEIAYFDHQDNSTGALCTRLSTEASAVQGATGVHIGNILQNFCNLGTAVILSFVYGWALTLIIMAFLPFIILSGYLDMYFSIGFVTKSKKALEDAGRIAAEAIQNIRTVVQLTKEKQIEDEYWELLSAPYKTAIRSAHISGVLYSLSNSVMFFMQAALFAFGGWMVSRGNMTFENVLVVLNCVLFGAMAVGEAASLVPDYSKAVAASKVIIDIFDKQSKINEHSSEKQKLNDLKGEIQLQNVHFNYPNRSNLLTGLNLDILSGQHVALVGSSGCGKSTCIQLMERFYDPTEGCILIDGFDVCKINRQWWRSQIGLVSQEPRLFDGTVKENIAYGDVSREVSMDEIIDAAKSANIHNFIQSLPEGYDTNVGTKGTQLSGGEKQRIAIARALIKRPKILLLDEATSALDSESESIVQEALDRAAEGRTTIIIAHRFSTIRNADLIFVLKHGQIVEYGKHDDLLKLRGHYYKLAQMQAKKERPI